MDNNKWSKRCNSKDQAIKVARTRAITKGRIVKIIAPCGKIWGRAYPDGVVEKCTRG